MVKRLRENRKNKKGFTLVELIVVIVIILVLAAVMVPSVLRYVDKANKANCKSDAASILVDVQAQVVDLLADTSGNVAIDDLTDLTVGAVTVTLIDAVPANAPTAGDVEAHYLVNNEGDVIYFDYTNARHTAVWNDGVWSGNCME